MKKNLLSVLLAFVLVLSLMVLAIPAYATEETPESTEHTHCICVRSEAKPADHVCDETIVWEPYVKGMTLVDGGHYYLTGDVGETRNLTSSSNKLNITICLNGHTFRAQTPFKVQNGNTLTICDCQGGGAIRSSKADGTGYSVWAGYNKAVVNLYSGILSGQFSTTVFTRPVVVEGGTFNMYGGTIKNGDSGTVTTGSPNVGYGGNVLIKNYVGQSTHVGTFNMLGGTIEGGNATVNGGNFYVLAGVLNISGGVIKNGTAVSGGNIAANGDGKAVTLSITGGTVQDGVATEKGGNIYLQNTTNGCVFSMSNDALVTGGQAAMGGNIASYLANPTTGLKGGTISNGVATTKGGNIYVESANKVNTFTLAGTTVTGGQAKSVVAGTDADGNPTEEITWGNGGNIYVDSGSKLALNSGSITAGEAAYGGNVYIGTDVTVEKFATQVTNGIAHNNGGNIWTGSALTLSEITVSGGHADGNGGNILMDRKVLTLNGTTVSGGTADINGGNISVTNTGAQLHATNATIENGTAVSGGNIYTLNVPTIQITDGSITGGQATNGGNIYSTHTSMTATRKLTISGTTVSNGTAEEKGGNLYIAKVGIVKLENVICDNGSAKIDGSNVYMEGNFDVTFTGGTYSVAEGGRKYTYTYPESSTATEEEKAAYLEQVAIYGLNNASTKLISEGGKRLDGNGGNICIAWGNNKVTETTDSETGETVKETTPNSTKINGTVITGGNAANGGALYVGNANVTIENMTAKSCGGASGRVLHVAKAGVVTLKDSTLVNWGTQGSTVYSSGSLTLVGEVKLDKEFNANERKNGTAAVTTGMILDAVENENAIIDFSGLTAAVNRVEENMPTVYGISMTRYGAVAEDDTKLAAAGKLATGINDTNRDLITVSGTGFTLTETDGDLYMNNAAIQGIKADGAITNGGADFAEITANHKDSVLYYIVNENLENAGELGVSIILDLNGKTVSGASVAAGNTLQLMDNKNDGYDETKCGTITVTGDVDPITHIVVPVGNRHYVALPSGGNTWTAHRYLAYITDTSLNPAKDALGFKASFYCDDYAQQALQGVGYQMSAADNAAKVCTKTDVVFDDKHNATMYLRVKNIMKQGGGEMKITGNAVLVFEINGETVYADTSAKSTTMKQTIRTINGLENLTDAQKTAVYSLYEQYASVMSAWFTAEETNNIETWAPAEEEIPAA